MAEKINNLQKKIKRNNQGTSYEDPKKIKIDKSFAKAQSPNEALKTQINKDVLRLQAANANTDEIQQNLQSLDAKESVFFQILDYMSRIPRSITSFLGAPFASVEQWNELSGMDPGANAFTLAGDVLTTGKARGQAEGEEFTGANMLQTIFSNKTTSTQDWGDIWRILGSIATEFPVDPLTYLLGPALRTASKAVKAGTKGGFAALKAGEKTAKAAQLFEDSLKGTTNLTKAKNLVIDNLKKQNIPFESVDASVFNDLVKKELKGVTFGANKIDAIKNAVGAGKLRNVSKKHAISESNVANLQKLKSVRERKVYKELQNSFENAIKGNDPEVLEEFTRLGILPKNLKLGSDGKVSKALFKEYYQKYFPKLEAKLAQDVQMLGRPFYQEGLPGMLQQLKGKNAITKDNREIINSLMVPEKQGPLAAVNVDAVKYPMKEEQIMTFVDDLRKLGLLPLKGGTEDYLLIRRLGGTEYLNPATNQIEKLAKEQGGVEFYLTEKFIDNLKNIENAFFKNTEKVANTRRLMNRFETLEKFAYDVNLKTSTTDLLKTYKSFDIALSSMLTKGNKVRDFDNFRLLYNKIRKLDPELGKEMSNQIAKIRRLDARYRDIKSVALRKEKFGVRAEKINKSVRDTLSKVRLRIDNEYDGLKDIFRKRFDKVVDMGEEYVVKNNPTIRAAAQKLQDASNLRFRFAKTVGATDEIIDEFVYLLDSLGKPIVGTDGNPLTKQYLSKVSKNPDELVKISKQQKGVSNIGKGSSSYVDRVTKSSREAVEGNYRGSAKEWNEIRRVNQAKKIYNANKNSGNISSAQRWKDAMKLADNYDLFFESPFASSVKAFKTTTSTWGEIGAIRQAFKDNLIVPFSQIQKDPKFTDELLMGNFIELNHSQAGNLLARMDPKLAMKVSSGQDITQKEIQELLQSDNAGIKELLFDGYKYDPKDKLMVNRHLNQLLTTWAPSAEETKYFVKGLDMIIGSWKKLALMSPGYLLRVITGDFIHGMMAGVPLGSMVQGWTKGAKELADFKNLDKEIIKISDNAFSSKEIFEGKKVSDIFLNNDIKQIERYVDYHLSPALKETQKLKRFYEKEGIINAGQWSQDSTFQKMNSSKDYDIFFKKEMTNRIKKIKNPTSANALKSTLKGASSGLNSYISTGHYSAMASRISVYKYMNQTKSSWRLSEKIGQPTLKNIPKNEIKNWQRLGFPSVSEATDFALYGNRLLSGFEKKYLTRLFPFYRFWRFALEQNIKNVMKFNLAPYYHVQKFMNAVKDGQDIDNKDIPDYAIQNNYLPIRLSDEKITLIKYGYTPSTLLNIADNPGGSALSEVLGQITPLIKATVEVATGTSTFTGIAYENTWDAFLSNAVPTYTTIKKKIKKAKKYADNPSREYTPIIDDLDSIFTTLFTEDVEKSRLYKTRTGLTEMMKKIRKDGGFIPNISDLSTFYNANVLNKKDYY